MSATDARVARAVMRYSFEKHRADGLAAEVKQLRAALRVIEEATWSHLDEAATLARIQAIAREALAASGAAE